MSKFTTRMLFASAALLAAVPAAAQYSSQDYGQSAPAPYDRSGDGSYAPSGADQDQRPRHQHGASMSLEQKAMWRAEIRHQVQGIPREQRKAYRQQLRAEFRSMDPAQRQQKFAEMERHWNALPADRREQILAKVGRHNGRHGQGAGRQDTGQYQDSGDRHRDRGEARDNDSGPDDSDTMDQQ